MKKRIQFMFENGNAYYMEMLFGTDDISDLLNKAEYISELESYDRNMLKKMEETQAQIEASKHALQTEQGELQQLVSRTEAEQASVEVLIADKQSEIESYESQISDTEARIAQQQKELQEEQELIAQMKEIERQRAEAARKAAEAGKRSSGVVYSGEGFIWPVSSYTITSEFGYRTDPINGTTSYHSGIDIAASMGSEIHAVADGEVAWSYYSTTAGNWIGIDHGNDIYSVYMHCSVSNVSAGDKVSQGDVIGLVGSTGRSTGPHLHLSIRYNGEYVNPHDYVG
ncbi:MAG: peptidoglycan DD-metalloendopeptidase family protein [Lachnospiraceae bacterium]|nr:peptidoglycan DD-metalloendopeptidase family protein [Lachnospiraceae bacterium]